MAISDWKLAGYRVGGWFRGLFKKQIASYRVVAQR
jgi:hypothetical protein